MSIYDQISQGMRPIGADLPQVANALNQQRHQNALLGLHRDQFNAQQSRLDRAEDRAGRASKAKQNFAMLQWGLQNNNSKEMLLAMAEDDPEMAQALSSKGIDLNAMDENLAKQFSQVAMQKFAAEAEIAPHELSQKDPGQLYQIQGEDGPRFATAEQAIGQAPYKDPKEKGVGQLYQVSGPDGKPRFVTAEQALGQQPFVKGSDKPPPDPAAQAQDAQNVLAAINSAESLIGANTTGFIGQKLGGIGGTEAYDLRAALDTVKASIGFDRLQRMREESKTGGALGSIAVRELDLLQATIASLDANQSGPQLRANLQRVRRQYEKAMGAYQAAMNQQSGSPQKAKPESKDGWSIEPVQ